MCDTRKVGVSPSWNAMEGTGHRSERGRLQEEGKGKKGHSFHLMVL